MFETAKQKIKGASANRHRINLQSTHEVEHDSVKYRVAKTDKGLLVLFPHAKAVTVNDFLTMMNAENEKIRLDQKREDETTLKKSRLMEWKGHAQKARRDQSMREFTHVIRTSSHGISSNLRKNPLQVVRRVKKPIGGSLKPIEEAIALQIARKEGTKCEAPVAVFLPKPFTAFPEMLFTTTIAGTTSAIGYTLQRTRPRRQIRFEDVRFTSKGSSPVYIDAERNIRNKQIIQTGKALRRLLKRAGITK